MQPTITAPGNRRKVSLPHRAAASSHSFTARFHSSLPSVWPYHSLHHQSDATWKSPLFVREGAGVTDSSSAAGPDSSRSYTQSFGLPCLILALKFSKRWVRRCGRVNAKKRRAALLPGVYQRWQDIKRY